jgi:hypothetical protein
MVFVYLMGLADIFAAGMIVSGLRLDLMLYFTIAMLGLKGVSSFLKPNPILYVMGTLDLVAIALLLSIFSFGSFTGLLVLFIAVKGLISFWDIAPLRNSVIALVAYTCILFDAARRKRVEDYSNYYSLYSR